MTEAPILYMAEPARPVNLGAVRITGRMAYTVWRPVGELTREQARWQQIAQALIRNWEECGFPAGMPCAEPHDARWWASARDLLRGPLRLGEFVRP